MLALTTGKFYDIPLVTATTNIMGNINDKILFNKIASFIIFALSKIIKKYINKRGMMNRGALIPITDGSDEMKDIAIIDVLREIKAIVLTGYPSILGLLAQRIIPGHRPLYLHIYSVLSARYRW